MGYASEGGELDRSGELPAVPRPVLGGALEPVLSRTKPRGGYFLRAESFFDVARFVDRGTTFVPDLSLYGNVPLHQQSHGESFSRWPPTASAPTASTSAAGRRGSPGRTRSPARAGA